jgi:hypothetical protein
MLSCTTRPEGEQGEKGTRARLPVILATLRRTTRNKRKMKKIVQLYLGDADSKREIENEKETAAKAMPVCEAVHRLRALGQRRSLGRLPLLWFL